MGRLVRAIKGFTRINLIVFFIFATALDSESWIPMCVCAVTGIWLVAYAGITAYFGDLEELVGEDGGFAHESHITID